MTGISVSITKFPGETKTLRLPEGATVADAAKAAQFSLEGQEIRVNEEAASASQRLQDDDDVLISKAMVSQR